MPTGDDALAAGMTILDGSEQADDIDLYINETRDFIAQHAGGVAPVAKGGTGSSTAAGARANLSVPSLAEHATKADAGHIHAALYGTGGGTFFWRVAPFNEWNTPNNLYVGGYINTAGGLITPSTRRVKENITPAPDMPGIYPALVEYERIGGDGRRELGYVAEDMMGTDAERFVVLDAHGDPVAVNYLSLLVAQVARLATTVVELQARVEVLEAGDE
jgi:hypothetical protein